MAAMALVFVGLMFIGGDVSGGSLTGMFKQTFVSVDGKSYGEKAVSYTHLTLPTT